MKGVCVICGIILGLLCFEGIHCIENCSKTSDTCSNGTVCDMKQETPQPVCLIKVNENCTNESKCVTTASCQSNKCVCNSTLSVASSTGICLSKSGVACTTNNTCISDAICTEKKCKCNNNVASDGMCTSGAGALVNPFILVVVFALGAAKLQSISDTA